MKDWMKKGLMDSDAFMIRLNLLHQDFKGLQRVLNDPQLQPGQATSAVLPPIPDVPLHAPTTDPYLTNQAFFESLSLDSHELHQVHGSSITWPLGAVDAIDTTFGRILQHVLTDLDKDAPVAALL